MPEPGRNHRHLTRFSFRHFEIPFFFLFFPEDLSGSELETRFNLQCPPLLLCFVCVFDRSLTSPYIICIGQLNTYTRTVIFIPYQ